CRPPRIRLRKEPEPMLSPRTMATIGALLATAAPAHARPDCEVHELETLGGNAVAGELNDDGQIVGASTLTREDSERWIPVRWDAGKPVRLEQLDPELPTVPVAINRAGVIVGNVGA